MYWQLPEKTGMAATEEVLTLGAEADPTRGPGGPELLQAEAPTPSFKGAQPPQRQN